MTYDQGRGQHATTTRRETTPIAAEESKKRRRDYGGDGIPWDKTNKVYVGTISLGFTSDGRFLASLEGDDAA